jgi:phage terminase large subunit-like protein
MREFHRLVADVKGDRFATFNPYPWQAEFIAAGKDNPERLCMAANRVGKTALGGFEVTCHLTGLYPTWWNGKVFHDPVLVWTGSPTNETSRDIVQAQLLGAASGEDLGTGWVPQRCLHGEPTMRQAGVRGVVDAFQVRHITGGLSTCNLKSYEQGWTKYQGTAPHAVWLDEEPEKDERIYTECQTRILTSGGVILVTFTPLHGVTELVDHFLKNLPGTYQKGATWDDAPHLDDKDRRELAKRYRAHEVEARTKGVPMLGQGRVFPIDERELRVDPIKIPTFWARGKGCDFGIDHPAAGVECAWDRDKDIIYVTDCYKEANQTAVYHATWLNKSDRWVPVFWPHDGLNREKSGGRTLADHYREAGVNMFKQSARYKSDKWSEPAKGGAQPVEPILEEILERMKTGRFKVFSTCTAWCEEFRNYHRRDGRLATTRDDILKATFYAVMMKRYWADGSVAFAVVRDQDFPNAISSSQL